uniref:Uncharacterized protein n=1 Tax=Oryza rufipogon TaxID=4529 RepID=A0A0E0PPJ4_ORYRU
MAQLRLSLNDASLGPRKERVQGPRKEEVGLSGSTALRELHLAENKISDVEGLHRLLKPTWRVPTL